VETARAGVDKQAIAKPIAAKPSKRPATNPTQTGFAATKPATPLYGAHRHPAALLIAAKPGLAGP